MIIPRASSKLPARRAGVLDLTLARDGALTRVAKPPRCMHAPCTYVPAASESDLPRPPAGSGRSPASWRRQKKKITNSHTCLSSRSCRIHAQVVRGARGAMHPVLTNRGDETVAWPARGRTACVLLLMNSRQGGRGGQAASITGVWRWQRRR
jgi:hypothetical protein